MPRSVLPWSRLTAEFLVIVVGVLVALAVDAMVERREERRRERAYIEELRVEVDGLGEILESIVESGTALRETQQKVIDGLAAPVIPPADSMGHWFDRSLRTSTFRPYTPIADALIETGDLSLILDDDVRRAVIAYRSAAAGARDILDNFSQMTMDTYARISRRVDRPRAARGDVDWQDLADDIAFRGDFSTYAAASRGQGSNFQRTLDAVTDLRTLLDVRSGR